MNVTETTRSEFRAQVVIERIDNGCEIFKIFPLAGRVRPEFKIPGLRSLPIRFSVIFHIYEQAEDTVKILRIIDGRRDLKTVIDLDS